MILTACAVAAVSPAAAGWPPPRVGRQVLRVPDDMARRRAQAEVFAARGEWGAVAETLAPVAQKLDADGALLLAGAHAQTGQAADAATTIQHALERFHTHAGLWLAWIDAALREKQWTAALQRIQTAAGAVGDSAELHWRAAQAYFHLGAALGKVETRSVPEGRAGQFAEGWLLLEPRGPDRFLCCPPASALNQLRRALDAGLDLPAAHALHARIWQAAGQPKTGLDVLKTREAAWLEHGDAVVLETLTALALEAGALDDYLRYARRAAARTPGRRDEILGEAYRSAARSCAERGEWKLCRGFCYRALALRPHDVELMCQVADLEWAAGRLGEAGAWYRRVLERQPGHPRRMQILERLAAQPAESRATPPPD